MFEPQHTQGDEQSSIEGTKLSQPAWFVQVCGAPWVDIHARLRICDLYIDVRIHVHMIYTYTQMYMNMHEHTSLSTSVHQTSSGS